ncbi:MAG: discoidin domain-containing protein [Chloroflexota bacterium]|nr:MAG: hypothetical protein DLM70_08985 [Chloroflexota bacterium]
MNGKSRRWQLAAVAGLALAVAVALFVSRSASSNAEGPVNFQAIQVGHIAMEADPSGRTAILRVHTAIKAICAVAYGRTGAYGHLATDRAMDPSGHQNHAAFLTGLQPGTAYVYRLQGVGVDGRLYRSPVYSFRTPVAVVSRLQGRDVAMGATVLKVSSAFSSDFAGKNAVDGDPGTEWASQGDGNHAFITIDLHRVVKAIGVAFRTRSMSDGTAITRTFSVTVDGKKTYGPFPASPYLKVDKIAFSGRIVRFSVVTSTGGNTGASEVAVYASR